MKNVGWNLGAMLRRRSPNPLRKIGNAILGEARLAPTENRYPSVTALPGDGAHVE
ncbi:MAG: hypothetical protein FWD58_10770 [Firmicutes bacterium]|nr:hypothetical protein [Bacillota bacterium]